MRFGRRVHASFYTGKKKKYYKKKKGLIVPVEEVLK